MSAPTFRHDQDGQPADTWDKFLAHRQPWLAAGDLLPEQVRHLVVVAAHPDDDTLGAGGLTAWAARHGVRVSILVASDGEGSHPSSPTHTPAQLAARRRAEAAAAVSALAPSARLILLGLPDGRLRNHEAAVTAAVVEQVGIDGLSTLILSPWQHDRHPDHEAVARASALAAARTDARHDTFPIWAWHWGSPADLPWDQARLAGLDETDLVRKREAISRHTSQVRPLSGRPGDETLLRAPFLAHFDRPVEVFFRGPAVADTAHDDTHRASDDPWRSDSWYERRKRAVTLASLPRSSYRRVLEVGCSTGALTAELAERAQEVIALDISPAALKLAQARLADDPRDNRGVVQWHRAAVPQDWPAGSFDLVVLSEVGYYLSPQALSALTVALGGSLDDRADVLACHWLPRPRGWPLHGALVHDRLAQALESMPHRVSHREPLWLLDVWSTHPPQDPRDGAAS